MPELTPEQKQRLQEELTKYAKEGASDDQLRSFKNTLIAEYERQNTSVKKKDSPVLSASGSTGFVPGTDNISQSTKSKSPGDAGIVDIDVAEMNDPQEGRTLASSGLGNVFGRRSPSPTLTEKLLQSTKANAVSLVPTPEQNKMYEQVESAQVERIDKKANEVYRAAMTGTVNAKDLAELYQDPRGKDYAIQIMEKFVPELEQMGGGLDKEVFGNERKWDAIAKKIKEKNRVVGVAGLDGYYNEVDKSIADIINSSKATRVSVSGGTGGAAGNVSTNDLLSIDINDPSQFAALINQVKGADFLSDEKGAVKKGEKEKLLELLQTKAMALAQRKAMSPEIEAISDKTKIAITRVNLDRELGENIKTEDIAKYDEVDQRNFETGLNYIQDVDPGKYKNVVRAIREKEKVADIDFRYLSRIGQEINNEKIFRDGAVNPESIDKETSLDYLTRQDKKSMYASAIGEYLKEKGFRNVRQFSASQIRAAAANIPGLNNKSIIDELVAEEGMLAYDAIPKSGKTEAFVRGVMTPFEGIRKTVDVLGSDETDTYLRSQQYDVGIGGQKVVGQEGQMSTRLASDRGNVWYDVMEGFGQFIPQVILTRGIGSPLSGAARLSTAAVPRAALTAGQAANITNYGGTFISTYLQEYGSAYEDALQKTGNPNLARSMGAINGISAASFELFLPDTKIADKAMGIFRKSYAGDLIDIIKKGGSVENMARKGRGVIEKFVGETLGIAKQEVKEEVGTQLVNYITESIFSPATAADRNLSEELLETAKATAISMLIPAVLGGAGAAKESRTNQDFTVNGLHSAAINIKDSQNALEKALIDDQITQDQFNNGMKLLNTHRESINNSPKESSNGKVLSHSERLEYAYQSTLIKGYGEQLKEADGDVAKEDINNKIKKSEDVQRKILLPETVDKKEGGDDSWRRRTIPIEEQEKLETDAPEEQSPEEIVIAAANDDTLGAYSTMVAQQPEMATEVLRDFAQQIHGIDATGAPLPGGGREAALSKNFSNDVLEAAKQKFPTAESTLTSSDTNNNNVTEVGPDEISKPIELNPLLPGETVQDRSGAAVIMPAENTSPNIVSLKKEGGQDAIQEQSTTESVLRDEGIRGESGLQEVESNNQSEIAPQPDQEAKPEEVTVESFADRITAGEQMTTPEDLQFYDNNREAIESELKKRFSEQAKIQTEEKEPTPEERKRVSDTILDFAQKVLKADISGQRGTGTMINIFAIPQQILGRSIQVVGLAYKGGEKLVDAIQKGIDLLKGYGYDVDSNEYSGMINSLMEGKKPKFKVRTGETKTDDTGQQYSDAGPNGQDSQSEDSGQYNFGERKFGPGNDPIENYTLQTSGVEKMFGTELTEQIAWNETPSQDRFQAGINMLEDGKEMIGAAQTMFGGADVRTYGPPLFAYIKAMPPDGTAKKAILFATFIGEIKNQMERTGSRELQELFAAANVEYRNFMHVNAKNLAAGRLLRLFRDKYMADIFQDIILEEEQVKQANSVKDNIADTNITNEDAEAHQQSTQKGKTSAQVNKERKDSQDAKTAKATESDGRKKTKKDVYEDLYKKKEAEVKAAHGDQQGLINTIIDKINKLNCP